MRRAFTRLIAAEFKSLAQAELRFVFDVRRSDLAQAGAIEICLNYPQARQTEFRCFFEIARVERTLTHPFTEYTLKVCGGS